MSNYEAEGKRKTIEGEVREQAGKMAGDKIEQIRGEGEKIEGRLEEGAGRAKRKIERR